MKDKPAPDSLVLRDQAGRRQFIRTGSAFLLAGSGAVLTDRARADECDRAPTPGQTKQPGNGSDSDAGDNADPIGCGRRQETPKISSLDQRQPGSPVDVVRVKS